MEPLWLQLELLAVLENREHGAAVVPAAYKHRGWARWASGSPTKRVGRSAAAWSSHRTCLQMVCLAAKTPWLWATQDIQDKSQQWSNTYIMSETKNLKADQWLVAMNICMESCLDKKKCVTHINFQCNYDKQIWDEEVGKMEKWSGEQWREAELETQWWW